MVVRIHEKYLRLCCELNFRNFSHKRYYVKISGKCNVDVTKDDIFMIRAIFRYLKRYYIIVNVDMKLSFSLNNELHHSYFLLPF